METRATGPQGKRRGRGARERLLQAAGEQFRAHGLNQTGMDQLCAAAQVSKRTAYQHFGSKSDLAAAYLQTQDLESLPGPFRRPELSPRDQLLAVFAAPDPSSPTPLCPFIGAAVETTDHDSPIRVAARDYKHAVATRLSTIAQEGGARDPDVLGEQLALLLDGASTRTHVLGSETLQTAAVIAATLIDAALPTN